MLVAGLLVGLRFALPVVDVTGSCPTAGHEGHTACYVNHAYLPAIMKVMFGLVAGHMLASMTLDRIFGTAPAGTVRRRRGDGNRSGGNVVSSTVRVREHVATLPAEVQVKASERRMSAREDVNLRVEVRRDVSAAPIADVITSEASVTGLPLGRIAGVSPGEPLWLTVHLSDHSTIEVGSRVVRMSRRGDIGVAFDGLSAIDRGRLAGRLKVAYR